MFLAALPLRSALGDAADLNTQIVSALGNSQQLWHIGLIFLRLTSLVMLVPGLGDQAVPARVRLSFALLLSIAISPMVGSSLPPLPPGLGGMTGDVLHEVLIGLMLGTLMRVLLYTLTTSGEIISLHSGLSFAQTANPAEAQPSSSIGTFLAMLGLVLIWSTNLHHLFIRAMVDSYTVFPATRPVMINDGATLMVRTVGDSFVLAMQMSAPIIVFSLVFNIATGFVARIMPNFPVFFAATPLSLLLSMALLAMGLGGMGMAFLDHYQDMLGIFIRSGHG
ncbi:flagellar biosynthetic protein FliR [Asticcacaulis sp. EMRT-3]|uniref:flagellar biosynthetic protein FliR n=1 Tax=Asticcacaulis sp. EMRT-3 TaxID=3040349 RepID=UPI0024AEA030|nr:flagellar biosynthetic protein FliR [Asticcacaulis sp. EMRT-3]MDI7773812.1 flagellar biosynthetic protein FliR [Asticcacaulis sp. EMRT-3]